LGEVRVVDGKLRLTGDLSRFEDDFHQFLKATRSEEEFFRMLGLEYSGTGIRAEILREAG
jgi:hypothetical protein